MADLLDVAIEQATQTPQAAELHRKSRRFEELRASPAFAEFREEFEKRRQAVTEVLGKKALRGVSAQELRDEGIYSRGFLDGMELLLNLPEDVEKRLEVLIATSYNRIRHNLIEAAGDDSPYG
jgi:hypothetical protein